MSNFQRHLALVLVVSTDVCLNAPAFQAPAHPTRHTSVLRYILRTIGEMDIDRKGLQFHRCRDSLTGTLMV